MGYEALSEWRRVQEERPRPSTSGGQLGGGEVGDEEGNAV